MHAILIATAALVGLPILLHLIMKQEPKRLVFPAMRFLQQRRKSNQRKMKLRQFLLMALRMLLIALFGLAIFQPILPSTGLDFGVTLAGEQPVAAVVIIDTSPSMGYTANGQSRLSEARRRALELLDDLPANSRVAVLDPATPGATWEPSISDARRRIESMKEPHGVAIPVTTALAAAYQLLRTVDADSEAAEPLPRLVAVFSDRTATSWDATRQDDLVKVRDQVPQPPVAHLFVDVGIEQPADVAVTTIELKPQIVPQGQTVILNGTITTAGPGVEALVRCKVSPVKTDVPPVPDATKLVIVAADSSAGVSFSVPEQLLRPGLYQAELRLETSDNLAFDNVRYVTFKVAEPRKTLVIGNDEAEVFFWRESHDAKGEFDCEFKKPAEVTELAKYEVVALLSVTDPTKLWPKLLDYVNSGGKLLILPGSEAQVLPAAYQASANEATARLLPGSLKKVIDTETLAEQFKQGVPWRLDDDALKVPFLAPFRDWKLRGDLDVVVRPRRAWKFWEIEKVPESTVLVRYTSGHAAMLERIVGPKGGKVLLFTSRLDSPPENREQLWNDYWDVENSWITVFPNLLMRYLAGDPSDTVLNFTTGQAVPLPVPRGGASMLRIEGPGVTVRDAEIPLDAKQAEMRLTPSRTGTAGSFRVFTPSKDWLDGFSLNPPSEECSLARVPSQAIEGLFSEGSVIPIDRKLSLREVLKLKYDQPLDLFPFLLIAVLFLLALEAFVANQFYRNKP